jgi:phage FluMu protein Com
MARKCRCPRCDSMNTVRTLYGVPFVPKPDMTDEEKIAFCKSLDIPIRYMYHCNDCQYFWKNVERRSRCPKCGSLNTVKIIYGLPGEELIDLHNREKILLGGCMVWPNSPKHYCKDCHNRWGKLRSGDI